MHLVPKPDGTFLFPPFAYADVQTYADFWMNVSISDGILSNITAGYDDLIEEQANPVGTAWRLQYDSINAKELAKGDHDTHQRAMEKRTAAHRKHMAEWRAQRPAHILAVDARTIARAGQLSFHRAGLNSAGEELVNGSTMSVSGKDMTVLEIVETYQLGDLRNYFQEPEMSTAERIEGLRDDFRQLLDK